MWLLLTSALAFASTHWEVGYTGHLIVHPGLHGRVAAGLGQQDQWRLGAEVGSLVQPSDQLASWLLPRAALHAVGRRRGVWELALGLGVERTTWFGPTYAIENGVMKRRLLAGDTHALLRVDLATGRETEGAVASWTVRPSLGVTAPHTAGVGLDFLLAFDLALGGRR